MADNPSRQASGRREDLVGAIAHYEAALRARPRDATLLANLATALKQAGRLPEALVRFRQALALDDTRPDAWFNYANALQAAREIDEAEQAFRRALALDPGMVPAWFNLGNLLRDRDQAEPAAACYVETIRLKPDLARAHTNLGNVLRAQGRLRAALACHRRALALAPDDPGVYVNLGNVLAAARRLQAAAACYERALAVRPQDAPVLRALANVRFRQSALQDALALYRRALAVEPEHAETYNALGVVHRGLGNVAEALTCWQRAVALKPDYTVAHGNLGTLLRQLKRHGEALEHLRTALHLAPGDVDIQTGLAYALMELGQITEALAMMESAVARYPRSADAHLILGYGLTQQARIAEALAAFAETHRLAPGSSAALSNALFATLYSDRHDARAVCAVHRELAARIRPALPPRTAWPNEPDPERPLRVGYLSPDFRSHPVGFFIQAVLAQHRRDEVEVCCYSDTPVQDPVNRRLRGLGHTWRDCYGWPDARLSAQIAADGVDILVDLAGHTAGNRGPMLAHRPAPVQALYLGYPATSGMAAIDYVIADRRVAPPEYHDCYTEEVVMLDACFLCFTPYPFDLPVGPLPARANGYVTFGSYNTLCKLSPATVALWSRVLRAVPGARLRLKTLSFQDAGTRELIWRQFAAHRIERGRVELVPPSMPLERFLAEYGQLDIGLDPVPYNGGTTTCDALWMGVPVVTLPGEHLYARMGLSLLQNAGLPELVAGSADEYVEIAAGLASDLDRLAALRESLRARLLASPVCDAAGFTRGLEAAYRVMWRRWCAR